MQIKLGEHMKELRLRDGRTQEALAEALGVTPQAVSRWECGICYPDMELIPSMANYFGVSIDELFGYHSERERKIDALAERIRAMNWQNNGVDTCMDDCIRLARESLAEFPGNEKLTLCLAAVLYNAGYVRYGEEHLTDADGYDIYDTARHRTYAEWREAIKLYEKLLPTLPQGEMRQEAVEKLLQLYVNTGEHEKAAAIADREPAMSACRELLRINTCDGKAKAAAYGEALLTAADTTAHLMISGVMVNKNHIPPAEAVHIIRNAIAVYGLVHTDGDYGIHHAVICRMHLYLSEHLWRAGDRDGAFAALDAALAHARENEKLHDRGEASYTSPLLRLVRSVPDGYSASGIPADLPANWPWWCVPDCAQVRAEITADPRWAAWAEKTKS